jgi:organic hydroperoxide reductase OsmC/OhrA
VHGLDNDRFRDIAAQARDGCPISRALVGNVAISLDAALD